MVFDVAGWLSHVYNADMFDGVVFSGGGCRCFWEAGFYSIVSDRLDLKPKAIAAASAGAALGCVSITGLSERALKNFKAKAKQNIRNFYPMRAFTGRPVFPHEELFRSAILETIDEEALMSLQSGPAFFVSLARAPVGTRFVGATLLAGISAYLLESRFTDRIHKEWPTRLGFQLEWARVDQCRAIEELADLLLHTSCTPPFTPAFHRSGRPVFDGGLIDNVPVAALDDCERVLVLLTRPKSSLPDGERVVYAAPSEAIAVEKWDYTNPGGLQSAFDLGRRDGETFARIC